MKFIINLLGALFFLAIQSTVAARSSIPTVWDVLRNQFQLNHELNEPEVQNQLRWLVSHPSYLQKLARSEPYIYHIVSQVKKRNLPGELALLPMLESAYDPFAYSGVGAAGLWQLMPGTGTNLGLKQDWWYDGRRSIEPSTDAALNYLSYLHRFFNGDWILAVAAYDSGEGTVSRAIKISGQRPGRISFWRLPVPAETRAYVPRLLALAEIIRYPERYHLTLPEIPHVPYFEEVNIGSQIDLNNAARLAGISYKELIKLNPGFNRWATAPYKPFKLLIPATKVAAFNRNLSRVPPEKRVSFASHQVKPGDNLNSIAMRYLTTTKLLREVNQLSSDYIKIGQNLLIPTSKNSGSAPSHPAQQLLNTPVHTETYKVIHIVQQGEDLNTIEKKYQVSTEEIYRWNSVKPDSPLVTGTQLIIWRQHATGLYAVKDGDSLGVIAQTYKTTKENLLRLNPELKINVLKPGQKIMIG